ncbi:MAG: DR2241 family protein [Halobacteriales archaeon]|nr:DR2241 family protein [Halobacteriales archaeon]
MSTTTRTDPEKGVRAAAESWFVGWVDEAETRRSWGELAVTAREDGYDVRHEGDVRVPAEELETYDDPSDALNIAKFDDEGEYRPMRGETTLPTGWVFTSLDADALVEVVRRVYPASVENAYLEKEGALDVTHWEETSERQTGRYADVDELTGDALRTATEAFCASRCVKRRVWEESESETIDSPTEGDFPCREACSLFVSGAREFVKQERQDGTSVDSRAEDTPRRGDLADPANEYRLRYRSRRKEAKNVR